MRAWPVRLFWTGIVFACVSSAQQMPHSNAPSGSLTIAPLKLEFDPRPVGTSSPPMTATLTNAGTVPVKFVDITPSGIDFSASTACGETLIPGASCEIQITFKPAITGSRLGVLSVMISGLGRPYFVGLSGVGQ
jgi:hypothetical protein